MNTISNLKRVWLIIAAASMILTAFCGSGTIRKIFKTRSTFLNAVALILSLPFSFFVVLVVALANHYLGINPFSTEGIYLTSIFLFVVGLMQWFWIARVWSPTEAMFQNLNLADAKID